MKYLNFIILFIFGNINLHAQATDFIIGLNHPHDLLIYEDKLYIAETDANRIIKVDLSLPNPIPEVVIGGVIAPYGLAINESELFFSQGPGQDKISKINLLDTNPIPIVIVENISFPIAIELNGNDLYIAQFYEDKISKIDISLQNPPVVEVINGIETPYALEIVGNDLYAIAWADRKLSKIDLTNPNPILINVITNLSLAVGIKLRRNELYIAEAGQSIGNDRISMIDVWETNPSRTTVVSGLYNPTNGLEIFNDVLYIAEDFKISKFELPPLSINDLDVKNISAYPNPTFDFLKISGLIYPENYKIYSILGVVMQEGVVVNNEKLNIENLPSGTYFLVLSDTKVLKIQKK
jgi:hypothetical protein